MRTNVLNDLSNVVKKGTGLACSWSQVGRMSEGAPDEHPMSIRSASDGERWKPAGEKGSTRVWKHVAMIFAVLVMSIANIDMAWGTESATNNPATVSYGTGGAAKTFLDVANTVSNCTISSGSVACVTYGLYEMDKNWKPAFYSGPANGSSSSYNYTSASTYGFMAGSSAGTGTAANKSATSGYGAAKYTSSAEAVIYVTGITGIAVMGKDNYTTSEKRLYIKVEEYAADGTCTDVGTTKSTYNKSLHITTFDAGTLSGTKYYKVTLTSGNTSNCETSQIRFTKYIAPSCTAPTASWSTAPADGTAGGNMNASLTTNYATGVVYSSSNPSVATVSGNGTTTCAINYVAAGSARITATVTGDGSTICAGPATCYTDITVTAAGSGWGIASSDNSWTASADEMSGSGTVTKTLSLSANADLQFKIVDISGNTWYGNGEIWGGTKTQNVSSTGTANNCHLLTTEAGDYTFSFNTSTKDLTITYPNSYTFYYANTGSWSKVYVYKFTSNGSTGNNAAWPGTQIASPAYSCGGTDYYAATSDGYAKLIFTNNSGNQTGDMVVSSSDAGKYVGGTGSSWSAFPTYTVTYNKNGDGAGGAGSVTGSVPTDSNSPYACGSTVTVLGNTGSLALDGYTFAGWNTAPGGGGTSYAADATFTISANTTLYAQWELIPTYDVIYNTNGGTGGSTASQTGNLSGAQVTTSANGFTKTGYKFKWWNTAANGSGEDFYPGEKVTIASANVNLYAQWEEVPTDWAYWVGDVAFSDNKADVTGNGVTMRLTNNGGAWNTDVSLDKNRVSRYNNTTDKHAKVLAVDANNEYLQVHFTDGSPINTLSLGVVNTDASTANGMIVIYSTTADFSSGSGEKVEHNSPGYRQATKSMTDFSPSVSNTYYYARIYRDLSTAVYGFTGGSEKTIRIYAVKAEKGQVCNAPSALAAASTTAKGTTFTVTDGDNTNNYDFYVSTSSSAPNAETSATYTSTSKTKTIDNLYAGTTFYAWVRSNCGVYGKSGWTALTGNTFTTSTVSVTHTLTNVTKTSGAATAGGSTYTAVYSANTDYSMPTPVVTIDGNTATSGTDYTWTAGTGTLVIPANKITGNIVITLNSAAAAPTKVDISGDYHYYPGDPISLSVDVTGGNGPVTYQWYHGGTADGNAIEGATSATFSKTCVAGDAGAYYCKVTCGGSASTWSDGAGHDPFNVKVMQFVLKNASGVTQSTTPLTKVDATHATIILHLTGGTTYKFRITDGCGNYYGNTGTMTNGNSTDWYMNADADCGMTTGLKTANYTFNVTLGDLGNGMQVTAVYPGGDQAAGKIIYWDNSVLNWADGAQWYRIGKSTHHNKTQMTKVSGTANLYKVTTAEYNGFEYWHIANNQGNGDGNLFWTKGDAAKAITNAMDFEGAPVTLDVVTVTPTTSHAIGETSDNDNCEFYTHTTVSGMKTDAVTISSYSNGTITVNYVDTDGEDATLTSGSANLAHTVILTSITAVPNTGYDASAITINGGAYSANYVVTGATTIAATFTLKTYTISYNKGTNGTGTKGNETKTHGVNFTLPGSTFTYTGHAQDGWATSDGGAIAYALSGSYTTDAAQTFYPHWKCNTPTITDNGDNTVTITVPSGTTVRYTTDGTNPTSSSGTVYSSSFSIVADCTVKAIAYQTGCTDSEIASQACTYHAAADGCWDPENTAADKLLSGDVSLTTFENKFSGVAGITSVTIQSKGTSSNGQCSGADEATPSGYMKVKNASSSGVKIITIVTTTAKDITIGGKNYVSNTGSFYLVKSTDESIKLAECNTGSEDEATNCPAGTYYIYAKGNSSKSINFSKLCIADAAPCSTVPTVSAGSNSAVTSTTATVSCTGGITSLGTGGCTITSYGFVLGTSANPTTSNTTYKVGTTYTSTGVSFSKDLTGLTASTTYYVRPYATNGFGTAYGTQTSFTTSAAEPTALVTWQMKVDQAAWALKSGTTEDGTNITSIASTADEPGSTSTGITGTTGKVVMASGESNVDKAASFTFTVNSAKKVVPEKVTCKVLNVSSGNRTYKAQLSDNNGHVYYSTNTVSVTTENVLTDATFNFASSLVLTGNVTLKVYAWKTSGSPTQFRMGEYVKLFGEVQSAADYTVTHTMSNVTKSAGATSVKEGNNYTATYAGAGGYALPENISVTIGGSPATAGTDYTWTQGTGVVSIPGNKVTGNIVITVTGVAPAPTYSVTHSLTNVTATSGATGAGAATEGVAYDAVFAANSGYVLPSTITVTIGGETATVGTGYTWNASTGAFQVPAAQVTGAIVITIAGETAPATKDIYYGAITITAGALTRGSTGTSQFFTNIGGTIANNTEISWSSGPGTGGEYYESNVLTDTELSKSSNWNTSSGSNRYVGGMKFQSGSTYTLALGSKVASSITFYGRNGSASKTMTVGGEDWTSSATKNTFAKHEFIKTGGFTGNVSITQDGDFYGILVITIQTATPCTTPVIPTLSNQSLCEGADIAAWNATVTNASTISAAGETVTYSWKKKGNDTELANTASFDLGASAAESQAGTYVVTVTVSKAGKASATATKEVTLTVNEATEVTGITADKATVYPTNSVTLTATANMDATWQWYTCTNAEGAGESPISGATSASYTITSAGSAGTYYYKVKATGDCGTGSMVYTLTVSAAAGGDCETEFWFAYDSDRPEGAAAATHITTALTAGSTASASITIDGNTYAITKRSSNSTGPVTIVIPEGNTGTVYVLINGSNSRSLTLTKGGVSQWSEVPVGWTSYSITGLDEGTYTLSGSGNLGWGLVALKLCSAVACTDPEVTASVNNSTACVGSSVTFTATGAHALATYQWQKYSGGAWTDIADATAATYNIASVATTDALKYRVIASNDCDRTSNEVTLSVPSAPNFGSTVPASVSVMQTIALSINTVEATDAVKYRWYKSADATWDAGDTEIGTNKELIKAYDSEAIGSPSYYIFCRAQNACGITTSSAIAVTVTAYVEEDCATKGNEGDAEFGFENTGCSQGTYSETAVWTTNSRSKYLTYTAPEGKYLKTAKVTVAVSSGAKCGYAYSTDGGTTWTYAELASLSSTLTEKTINLNSLSGTINAFRIGRNLQDGSSKDWGVTSGNFYLSKACFEYTNACTATTITPSTASVNYEMGGAWSNPTFSLTPAAVSGETLTYSSSNEDIASVDDDGTVTFNGEAGTVTITASYAGGTISATDYCASSGSYTITVSCLGGAPKVVADGSVDMIGCNTSVTLLAKKQDGTAFADGTYQWFRNGTEIDGATSSSYTATQAGTYTVERTNTSGCTTPSTNSAVVTSETTEPEVERLVPFQYYHVDKTYSDQMKMRHLFAVKNSGKLDGKSLKMYVSRNGGAATDVTSSNALVVRPNGDGHVDTVMVDLNKLSGKYSEDDELVFTCKAIDCSKNISEVYKNTITMNVIGATPTLALICSGSNKASGTRKTSELTVGGDFLTGYNVADLCQQTGNTSFDANTEWGLYTRLKENYIVTPVNGYAVFNKLNYEPFDILLLTDYPKASKSDAAATVLDDMAALCDYRPMLSFKAHMVSKSPSKWAAKGFTTSPVVPKNTRTRLNIVCYAHPMFADMKTTATHIQKDNADPSQIVYTMLTGAGYEGSKGLQGFELEAAENFVTIGLVHYNATPTDGSPSEGFVTWAPGSEDRMLVTAVERQENPEARMIMFAVNCGAQSKFTETGRNVVLRCLEYLLTDATITPMADCSFTFDNGAGNSMDAAAQSTACPTCTGTKGDGKWSTAANWGPDYVVRPGKDTEVKIAAPVTVDPAVGEGAATNFTPKVRSVRILEGGKVEIPAGSYLEVVSTIRRMDDNDIYPTEVEDLHIGSSETGNGTLIFNNSSGDTKAHVGMYSKGFIDGSGNKNYQYMGVPCVDINAAYNYYGSWIYSWSDKGGGSYGWKKVVNGGIVTTWTGYCITQENAAYYDISGTLAATGTVDIEVPANKNMVVGNSWTAPIYIKEFTDDDFENLEGNVYFFNTGVDKSGEAGTAETRYQNSTYVTVPIHSSPYTGDSLISSMQGFFVKSNGSAGALHLDYDRHVRPSTNRNILSGEMHAPRRANAQSDEPAVLKIKVSGENYDDKLLLLAREDFSMGFDNGWDGDKWDGNESALYIYTKDEAGTENSVSAIPEMEGTVIGFRAGEDDAYTLHFEYLNSAEELYLFDTETNAYTKIMTGATYRFFTEDKEKHERFIITRKSPQIATDVDEVDSGKRREVRKLLIEDKMYILVNGMLYDATGKVVK